MDEALDRAADKLTGLGIDGDFLLTWIGVIACGLEGPGALGRDGYDILAAYADQVEDDWVSVWWMLRGGLRERSIGLHVSEVLRRALTAARGEAHED